LTKMPKVHNEENTVSLINGSVKNEHQHVEWN
jgi:hypothetical protein